MHIFCIRIQILHDSSYKDDPKLNGGKLYNITYRCKKSTNHLAGVMIRCVVFKCRLCSLDRKTNTIWTRSRVLAARLADMLCKHPPNYVLHYDRTILYSFPSCKMCPFALRAHGLRFKQTNKIGES